MAEIPGRRHKLASPSLSTLSIFVFNMAENGLFGGILSSDKNKTKHGIRFIFSQNVLDMHKVQNSLKLCKGDRYFKKSLCYFTGAV